MTAEITKPTRPDNIPVDVWQRIEAGAQFLDNNEPDWVNRINTNILIISDGRSCILAQATNSTFGRACHLLQNGYLVKNSRGTVCDQRSVDFGFFDYGGYRHVRAAWISFIEQRRETAKLELV